MYTVAITSSGMPEQQRDEIPFSVGNPSVEHITGTLHLYRQDPSAADADSPSTSTVCVLAVPADMANADLFTFFGSYMTELSTMRMVRREDVSKSVCMAVLDFKATSTAHSFIRDFNGKAYSSLEPDIICRVVAVAEVHMRPADTQAILEAPAGHTELPTCPVCLERLDSHISGVITTVCNHKFHGECLQQWGDASCPVCRYTVANSSSSSCETCGTSTNLWICLICGHVGCGRYKDAHARSHFEQTGHCYTLELETGRVWDYISDGYVHRLIQSSLDGKLVEVPSPQPPGGQQHMQPDSVSNNNGAPADACGKATSSSAEQSSEMTRAMHEDYHMLQATHMSKMDAVSREYTHLLTSQLESQRLYFEDLRSQDSAAHAAHVAELESSAQRAAEAAISAGERAAHAEAETKSLQRQLKEMGARMASSTKELGVLNELNRGLMDNQAVYKEKLAAEEATHKEKDSTISDLREQVRDLMVYLEASQLAGTSELAGGSAEVAPAPKPRRKRESKR